jgi:pyruvate-formate lyase
VCPSPLLNVFILDCLDKGRDISDGGARYNVVGPCFTGLANTINALYFIRENCFRGDEDGSGEDRIPLAQLVDCLLCDWGHQAIDPLFHQNAHGSLSERRCLATFRAWRERALAMPRWGRGDGAIDAFGNEICSKVSQVALSVFRNDARPPLKKKIEALAKDHKADGSFSVCIQPGVGTFASYVEQGLGCGASADGRRRAFPLATDLSAAPTPLDRDPEPHGVVSLEKALTGVNSSDSFCFWNGSPFDVNVAEHSLEKNLVQVLERFTNGCGTNILTVTVASPATFERATEDPEMYDLLRVRMGGWTEFFVAMMTRHQQTHIRWPFSHV